MTRRMHMILNFTITILPVRRRPSSCSQGEVAFPATCNLKPLDVTDLRSSWPKWHQQFQIYMTAHFDQSTDDHKRLAIFLNFLGPGALGIVNSLFPELINFESSSALKVSFEKKVLPTFANHCLSRDPQENFKQTVKLLNTVLEYDCEEPLLLYRELQEVWNSTGITCCRDRMLRNRFVQQIEDDDILAEIQEMKSPSSKEVLERYLEIERVSLWNCSFHSVFEDQLNSFISLSGPQVLAIDPPLRIHCR